MDLHKRHAGDPLRRLATLVIEQRDELLSQWCKKARQLHSARRLDVAALNHHIPAVLDELVAALWASSEVPFEEPGFGRCSRAHGIQRAKAQFAIEEVVAEYNILRGCIHDLAERHAVSLQGQPFHILNCVLDKAIGVAVQTFAAQKALETQQRREEHLAFIAHDLRTPLHAIALAACVLEWSLKGRDDRPQVTDTLRSLHRNVGHLQSLVGKVLGEHTDLGTEASLRLEQRELDLWALIAALLSEMAPLASAANTQLVNHIPAGMVVYADAGSLRRVFQNLLANAIKHTPRGAVVISASRREADGSIECQVADSGAGIAADRLEKIFHRYDSESPEGEGFGLGLAIVKMFVEAHGGEVRAESQLGRGATFVFTLPSKPS